MKGRISFFLGLLLLVGPEAAHAQFTYTTNADGATLTITGYTESGGNITIPSAIAGMQVTRIGAGAFEACSTSTRTWVTIPASVTNIGQPALAYCPKLTAITVFLPVVKRELRVAARGRATYRVRFWAVLVMLGVFVWFLNFSGMDPSDSGFGEQVMSVLLIPAFVLSLFIGVIATADCVSSEKREGTLGLLFLTDLKGYDVICGKLAANSVNAIYGLLAILPVLGLPVMLGGVTFAQFVKLAIALFSTMIFSLSAGIFVSTYSRNDRKAMFFTVLILLAVTLLPILLMEMFLEADSIPQIDLWRLYMFSPGYGIMQAMEAPSVFYPEFSYWLSMLWQWLLAAALIARASDHIPHSWEESAAKKKPRLPRLKLASRVKARSAKGRAWLKRNPFLWLAMQDEESSPRNVWLFVLAILAIWLIATLRLGMGGELRVGMLLVTSYVLHIPLFIWIAGQASRRFSEDRSNNTFESLLSTPLSARQIIRGQWLALLSSLLKNSPGEGTGPT